MKVIVYSRKDCNACYYTKRWLKSHRVDFTEIVFNDDDAETFAKRGYTTLPVVVCPDGSSWEGFRIDKLMIHTGAPTGESAQQPEGE